MATLHEEVAEVLPVLFCAFDVGGFAAIWLAAVVCSAGRLQDIQLTLPNRVVASGITLCLTL
ncbi:MAG TPA: hypothetical protein VE133_03485, partial [Candidatus Sulfotelmatobacter sp.]|nr:hypothetical protein [Candidatus Sulfotelmatobacter sp.]